MKPIKNRLCFLYTKHLVVCALLTMVVATTPLTHAGTGGQSPEADKPNILLILADDLGWNDVGYHGSAIETPVIDRLANEGIELDRFYAQPTCSPARAGLMTGKSPSRVGITGPLGSQFDYGLPAEEKILPQYLNEAGYRSVLIGKWHLGHGRSAYLPNNRGFSHFYGYLNGDIGYWDHLSSGRLDWQRNGKSVREEGYATQLLADEAIRIVDSHDPSTPLFLYLSMPAPHLPNEAPADTIAKYSQLSPEKRQIHAAMVTELDSAIGRVLEAFDAKGILNNTIVVFASDNGGAVEGIAPQPLRWGVDLATAVFDRPIPIGPLEVLATIVNDGGSDNTPLPSGKGNVAEGGVRVPAVVWWPQHLQAGRYAGFITVSDLLPTLLEAAAAPLTDLNAIDGRSQWQALTGSSETDTPDYLVTGMGSTALFRYPWKLVGTEDPMLFNVQDDPLEQRDLASKHPKMTQGMLETAHNWPQKSVGPELSIFGVLKILFYNPGGASTEPYAEAARD